MSLVGLGNSSQVPKPGDNLPALYTHEIDPIQQGASQIVQRGIDSGVIEPGLIDFAKGILGEDGREAALIVPTLDVINRHVILASAKDPETRSEEVYSLRHYYRGEPARRRYTWEPKQYRREEGYYTLISGREEKLTIEDAGEVATSEEQLDKIVAWRKDQQDVKTALEATHPAGEAVGLIEATFGGIDVTDPARAIRELSARALTTAILYRQHDPSSGRMKWDDERTLFDPRLKNLFQRRHNEAYKEFLNKIDSAATLLNVGDAIDGTRIHSLREMTLGDTERFTEQIWPDLERAIEIGRLGASSLTQVMDAMSGKVR